MNGEYSMMNSWYTTGSYTPQQAGSTLQYCTAAVLNNSAVQISTFGGALATIGGGLSLFGFPEAGAPVSTVGGAISTMGALMLLISKLFDSL